MKASVHPVEQYLDQLPEDRSSALRSLQNLILKIWPQATVDMTYGMPTFHLEGHPLCAMANQKHFMALYVMPYDLLHAFKNDLMVHDHGRSCIRFKQFGPEMHDLLDRVIKYTGTRMRDSIHFGRIGNIRSYAKA
jgi:uncharacterized protein YdhG (YjbR/CyaY superfamily)